MIWLITWRTESGDEGVDGYWKTKPSKEKVNLYLRNSSMYDEDLDAGTFYWELENLSPLG